MVVHETYSRGEGASREWIEPAQIKIEELDGKRRALMLDGGDEVAIGSIEKMSKSKKNVVDPDDIIASYGADTARFFVLSDSPPDRDVIWTESGVEGSHRFVQRVWRLVSEAADILRAAESKPAKEGEALAISQAAHKTLKAVASDYDRLAFNKAVARIYELVNALAAPLGQVASGKADPATVSAVREATEILISLIAPMTPHLAEECWKLLAGGGIVAEAGWPIFDEALVADNEITIPVQINGKKRADLTIARDADQSQVERAVLELEGVRSALEGKAPKKIIVVPQRIVNVVG
jgi:leucyl-tRNA synthetase